MTPRSEELLALARTRPLTPEERAELDPEAAAKLPAVPQGANRAVLWGAAGLVVVLAAAAVALLLRSPSGGGAGAAPAPVPNAASLPAPAPGVSPAPAAMVPPPPPQVEAETGIAVKLSAQKPGGTPRLLTASASLSPGELLQIGVVARDAVHVALYEEEGEKLRLLWASPAALPPGESALGPGGGDEGLELSPGRISLCLASRPSPLPELPETTRTALVAACPDCGLTRFFVQQR